MLEGAPANPFRYSTPVGLDDLIDRDAETAELLGTAAEGNNSRLVAPRRYGKTSLLRRALGEAAVGPHGWNTVYVDFFGVLTLSDVADRVERAYARSLTGPLARWFDGVRRTLRPTVTARTGPLSAKAHLDPPRAALADRLDLPLRLYERTGRRTLVVLDEFQELLGVATGADAVVRSSIQHHGEAAAYVFAGSHVGMMNELFGDRRRAFYAQARPVRLPPLPPDDCAVYVTRRFAESGRDVGDALGPLLDVAGGHPQRTMLLAHALWDRTHDGGRADPATLAAALDAVLLDLGDELRILWSSLGTSQRRVLAAVAAGRPPYGTGSGGSRGGAVAAALGALVDRGELLAEGRAPVSYRVVDPLVVEWLRRDVGSAADPGR